MIIDCVDVLGRRITLNELAWEVHVLTRRPWMLGWDEAVNQCLLYPDHIYQDKEHVNRECFYRLTTPINTDKFLKVVVEFDADGIGRVITAFPSRAPSRGEQPKWP